MCRPCADPWSADRTGFTLVELLLVIAVILVLAGMILAVRGPLMESQRASRTRAILSIIQQGLSLWSTEHGSVPSPVEHPFAGSKAPRLDFRGQRSGSWTDLLSTGEALCGVDEARLDVATDPTAPQRLLRPDDLFNEPDIPTFYGVDRSHMGILGEAQANITRRLDLSLAPGSGVIPAGSKGYRPYDGWAFAGSPRCAAHVSVDPPHYADFRTGNPGFPRSEYLVEGIARTIDKIPDPALTSSGYGIATMCSSPLGPSDQAVALAQYLTQALLQELRDLGGAAAPVDDDPSRLVVAGPGVPACAEWVPELKQRWLLGRDPGASPVVVQRPYQASIPRVWSDGVGTPTWEPGRIRASLDGSGSWVSYRLRGLALYDAWGTELLYMRKPDGTPIVISAGRDRCFALVPGLRDANGASIFATSLANGLAGGPVAPDRDGRQDNISLDGKR